MTPTQQWWDRFENAVRAADLDSAKAMVWDFIMSETPSPEELLRSREIFRDAFAHISMHMNEDGGHYFMPRNEWDNHSDVQNAIDEEARLIGESLTPQVQR